MAGRLAMPARTGLFSDLRWTGRRGEGRPRLHDADLQAIVQPIRMLHRDQVTAVAQAGTQGMNVPGREVCELRAFGLRWSDAGAEREHRKTITAAQAVLDQRGPRLGFRGAGPESDASRRIRERAPGELDAV